MGSLTIRNLDDSLLQGLRDRAMRSGRTIEEEAAAVLAAQVGSGGQSPDLIARLASLRAATHGMCRTPSEVLLREDRDGEHR
ncbi:FitA-like ribbon-helix-helix domain-containing protein [Niveispirillum fermenti]|uniref:FitA-like ribbon-helix-helix domain-containing protein n=1 Tax=Niveispirillum fermenti TaxID=1233113 RepID=UPI003A8A8AA7